MAVDENSQEGRSAKQYLISVLNNYGLRQRGWTPENYLWSLYQAGRSMDELMLEMRNMPEYRIRFGGLIALRDKGRAISEAEYIGLENSYAQIMRQYGLPSGFYDSFDDFAHFIGNDVSPREVEQRVRMAQDLYWNAEPKQREELQRLYGVSMGDMTAFFLDPGRALPSLELVVRSATASAAGIRAGMRQLTKDEAQLLGGMNPEEVSQRINLYVEASYGQPLEVKQELSRLYGITDLTGAVINPDVAIGRLRQQIEAGLVGGTAIRTGFGHLNREEAERLGPLRIGQETFQEVTRDRSLLREVLPGSETIDETFGRKTEIDLLAGNQPAKEQVERKRARRKAEFAGGGGVARTEAGYAGLGVAAS